MKLSTTLFTLLAGLTSASPVEKAAETTDAVGDTRLPFEKWTNEELREWNRQDILSRWPDLPETILERFSTQPWLEKYRKFKWAMEVQDWDWSKAYDMNAYVEDIHCAREETYASCQRRCRDHYQDKYKVEAPIYEGSQGVWLNLSHTAPGECFRPTRLCWNRLDWERKEEVITQQIGGEKAQPYIEGRTYSDIEIVPGMLIVHQNKWWC